MKVISGFLRGRVIKGYNITGTRPTMDRVKESIFSMIQERIDGSMVLDLFAGSGNYGIECLSRGAEFVYFNDWNKECLKTIKDNLEKFNIISKSYISCLDYRDCLKKISKDRYQFSLIFLDPPYKMTNLESILKDILNLNILQENGLIICEYLEAKLEDNYSNLIKIKERMYGDKKVYIYELKGDLNEIK